MDMSVPNLVYVITSPVSHIRYFCNDATKVHFIFDIHKFISKKMQSAISNKLSSISNHQSSISNQQSSISNHQ